MIFVLYTNSGTGIAFAIAKNCLLLLLTFATSKCTIKLLDFVTKPIEPHTRVGIKVKFYFLKVLVRKPLKLQTFVDYVC